MLVMQRNVPTFCLYRLNYLILGERGKFMYILACMYPLGNSCHLLLSVSKRMALKNSV